MRDSAATAQRRIGELAAELGLNPKTIRYYEEIGLLPEPPRTATGYRLYSEVDRERLAFILKARAIGLTLEEIQQVLALRGQGQPPCEHVVTLINQKVAAIDAHLRTLTDLRQELITLRDAAADSVRAGGSVCAIIEHHEALQSAEPAARTAHPASARLSRGF